MLVKGIRVSSASEFHSGFNIICVSELNDSIFLHVTVYKGDGAIPSRSGLLGKLRCRQPLLLSHAAGT